MKSKPHFGYEALRSHSKLIQKAMSNDTIISVAKSINALNQNNRIPLIQGTKYNDNSNNNIKISISMKKNIQEFDQWATSLNFSKSSKIDEGQFHLNNLKHIQVFSMILKSNNKKLSACNSAIADSLCFNIISSISNSECYGTLLRHILRSLSPILTSKCNFDFAKLRALMLVFYFPQIYEPIFHDTFRTLSCTLLSISNINPSLIAHWLKDLPNLMSLLLKGSIHSISALISKQAKDESWISVISPYIDVISLLYEINKQSSNPIPCDAFIIREIDLKPNIYNYQFFPFILSLPTRLKVIRYQVRNIQMASEYDNYISGNCSKLNLNIHRDSFYQDSKKQLISLTSYIDYFRRLNVRFIGESAIDAGGPCR